MEPDAALPPLLVTLIRLAEPAEGSVVKSPWSVVGLKTTTTQPR